MIDTVNSLPDSFYAQSTDPRKNDALKLHVRVPVALFEHADTLGLGLKDVAVITSLLRYDWTGQGTFSSWTRLSKVSMLTPMETGNVIHSLVDKALVRKEKDTETDRVTLYVEPLLEKLIELQRQK